MFANDEALNIFNNQFSPFTLYQKWFNLLEYLYETLSPCYRVSVYPVYQDLGFLRSLCIALTQPIH